MDYGIPAYTGIDPDDLAAAIAGVTPARRGDEPLRQALSERWPQLSWSIHALNNLSFFAIPGLVGADNAPVTDNLHDWLRERIAAAQGDWRAVWEAGRNDPSLIRTEAEATDLWAFAPLSGETADYIQLQITRRQAYTAHHLFTASSWRQPASPEELLEDEWRGDEVSRLPVGKPSYRLQGAWHVAAFLAEMSLAERERRAAFVRANVMLVKEPDHRAAAGTIVVQSAHRVLRGAPVPAGYAPYEVTEYDPAYLTRPLGLQRFVDDWEASSAGRLGNRLYDHWALNLTDYTDNSGRFLHGVPAWLTRKALPQVAVKPRDTAYALMDRLEKFDTKAGHPFAWFFFMLHGNRIPTTIGERIAEALEEGLVQLPAWDREILMRWKASPYGF